MDQQDNALLPTILICVLHNPKKLQELHKHGQKERLILD